MSNFQTPNVGMSNFQTPNVGMSNFSSQKVDAPNENVQLGNSPSFRRCNRITGGTEVTDYDLKKQKMQGVSSYVG